MQLHWVTRLATLQQGDQSEGQASGAHMAIFLPLTAGHIVYVPIDLS